MNATDPDAVFGEIKYILALFPGDQDFSFLNIVHKDIVDLFTGNYPGYRASNTRYHDLEHTGTVALAMARLIHGAFLEGVTFRPENIISGLISAFFHDTGLIQTTDDKKGSGAKYTVGHEMRSIDVVEEVLGRHDFSKQQLKDCAPLIKSTILLMPFKKINFRNNEVSKMGQFLGTADLLGQIADRKYLEKLILLFDEFEEAGIDNFESEIELLQQTEGFNKNIASKKMKQDFGNVARYMRPHFKKRWDIDKDMYAESVEKNIAYLKLIVKECKSDRDCFYNKLRRGGYW